MLTVFLAAAFCAFTYVDGDDCDELNVILSLAQRIHIIAFLPRVRFLCACAHTALSSLAAAAIPPLVTRKVS